MKLTKTTLKRIIREEVQKARKQAIKESSFADVARMQGVGPEGEDEMLDEMASFADTASEKNNPPPPKPTTGELLEWWKATMNDYSRHWWETTEDTLGKDPRASARLVRSDSGAYYIQLDQPAADFFEWPEELAANWTFQSSTGRGKYKYTISTDLGYADGS